MKKVVTHSGGFHADDVFAVAAFQLLLGVSNVEIIRTRDEDLINSGDYVVDVGGVYDHATRRYDHHQLGAPVRENGVPYAGFGLMWKHYGEEICGSAEIAHAIEEKLCQPVDAGDNGVSLYEINEQNIQPFELYNLVSLFNPLWNSTESKDQQFVKAVDWARSVLTRMIDKVRLGFDQQKLVKEVSENSDDKRILIFDVPISVRYLPDFPEVELIVSPDDPSINNNWTASNVLIEPGNFAGKAYFPKEWSGLRGEELQKISGIKDALFCHKACFFFVAGSKESAVEAARLAG